MIGTGLYLLYLIEENLCIIITSKKSIQARYLPYFHIELVIKYPLLKKKKIHKTQKNNKLSTYTKIKSK